MPSPREIALKVNRPDGFREDAVPAEAPEPREPDYRANPKNPPDGPPPATNIKGG